MPSKKPEGAMTPGLKKEEDVLSTGKLPPVTDDDLHKPHKAEEKVGEPLKQPGQKRRLGKATRPDGETPV
jgi:hypothetical protein